MRGWPLAILLFSLTVLSTLYEGALMSGVEVTGPLDLRAGASFALPLMAILLSHEMGHYVAARLHRVETSPPYFIPMPFLSLLGTMGAVIAMPGRIKSRNALFDIGAAGPLAGLVVALPVLTYGLATSPVLAAADTPEGAFMEGRSILYYAILWGTHGVLPPGHDVFLSNVAFAGWAGLLVTMMNLIPIGQLDGGHVAYALFGPKQNDYARRAHRMLPVVAVVTGLWFVGEAFFAGRPRDEWTGQALAGVHWLVWFAVIGVIGRLSGGTAHPPTEEGELSPGRRRLAVLTLVLFGLLFMPSWVREL